MTTSPNPPIAPGPGYLWSKGVWLSPEDLQEIRENYARTKFIFKEKEKPLHETDSRFNGIPWLVDSLEYRESNKLPALWTDGKPTDAWEDFLFEQQDGEFHHLSSFAKFHTVDSKFARQAEKIKDYQCWDYFPSANAYLREFTRQLQDSKKQRNYLKKLKDSEHGQEQLEERTNSDGVHRHDNNGIVYAGDYDNPMRIQTTVPSHENDVIGWIDADETVDMHIQRSVLEQVHHFECHDYCSPWNAGTFDVGTQKFIEPALPPLPSREMKGLAYWNSQPWTPGHGLCYPLIRAESIPEKYVKPDVGWEFVPGVLTFKRKDEPDVIVDCQEWKAILKSCYRQYRHNRDAWFKTPPEHFENEVIERKTDVGWTMYLSTGIKSTVRQTTVSHDAQDRKAREFLDKLKHGELKVKPGLMNSFVDIIQKHKPIARVAREANMKPGTMRQAMRRGINTPGENEQWQKASGKISTDGVYALATFDNRPPTAYQIMTPEQFLADGGSCIQMTDGLHNAVLKVLTSRIKNKRILKEETVLTEAEYDAIMQAEYDAVENELTRLAWRVRFEDKWSTVEELPELVLSPA